MTACRSIDADAASDLLMRYVDIRTCGLKDGERIAELAEQWTRDFLTRWSDRLGEERRNLTGHFSFDFIYERSEQKLYPIECNPVRPRRQRLPRCR